MEFGGQEGGEHFGISEGKGGVKILMPPVVGYGYFLESPNLRKGRKVRPIGPLPYFSKEVEIYGTAPQK